MIIEFGLIENSHKNRRMIDDNSREDSTLVWFAEIPFVTQKSIKSGNLFKSDGQYVGLPDAIWERFMACIALNRILAFGETILEPHTVFLNCSLRLL